MKKTYKIVFMLVAVISLISILGCDKKDESKILCCNAIYESTAISFDAEETAKKECLSSFSVAFYSALKLTDIKIENYSITKSQHIFQIETLPFEKYGYTEIEGGYVYHVALKVFVTPSSNKNNDVIEVDKIDFILTDANGENRISDNNKRQISVCYVPENIISAYSNIEDGIQNITQFYIKPEKTIKINSIKYLDDFIAIDKDNTSVDYSNLNLVVNANSEELIQIKHKMQVENYISATYVIIVNYSELGSNEKFDFPVLRSRQNKQYNVNDYFKEII